MYTLCYHYNAAFPLCICKANHKQRTTKKWITEEIRASSEHLRDLYLLQKQFPHLKDFYSQRSREHRALVDKTRKEYNEHLINNAENKTKVMWQMVHDLNNSSLTPENLALTENNVTIANPQTIVDMFNVSFQQASSRVLAAIPDISVPVQIKMNNSNMYLFPYTEDEMVHILSQLKGKHTSGPDEISAKIIKEFGKYLVTPITYLVNLSFSLGVFPTYFKISAVIPVHKRGDRNDIHNYRPISLISNVGKIFEYCLLGRINSFLEKYNILHDNQHGFRKGKSTSTALIAFYNMLIEEIDKKHFPVSIFCDFSKAFDCVQHGILMDKLYMYGIRGNAAQWISSYLTGRLQYVVLNQRNMSKVIKYQSAYLPVLHGIPQGSVIGPLLFNLYTNDIYNFISDILVFMYADDTTLFITSDSLQETKNISNVAINRLYEWFCSNKLSLNENKTNLLLFHTPQRRQNIQCDIHIGNKFIEQQSTAKFLGLIVQDNMLWDDHCTNLSKILHTKAYLFRSLRNNLKIETLLNVYYAEVQSRLLYGILTWGSSPAARTVFLAQKRIIRILGGLSSHDSCKTTFISRKILTLPCLYLLEAICYIHKYKDNYLTNNRIHDYHTRHAHDLRIAQNDLHITDRGLQYLGKKLYNKLPDVFKTCSYFKQNVRNYLTEKCFYSIEEFLQ